MFLEHIKGEGFDEGNLLTPIMPLVSGKTYVFYNHQGGTALDLDIGSQNVQGWTYVGGTNQQWKVTHSGDEGGSYWTIQNVKNGAYLAYKIPGLDGTRVICTPDLYKWNLSQEAGNEVYRIGAWLSNLCVDLADGGKSADGTPVQLWTSWGGDNQKWEAKEV